MLDMFIYCVGKQGFVQVFGVDSYVWENSLYVYLINDGSVVLIDLFELGYFVCEFMNICVIVFDSVYVNVIVGFISVFLDIMVCFGQQVIVIGYGNVRYWWFLDNGIYVDMSCFSVIYMVNVI